MALLKLGVFASGRGSNFAAILKAIDVGRLNASVQILISNNTDAKAQDLARERGIPTQVINKPDFPDRPAFLQPLQEALRSNSVEFICLAGYMKKIPDEIIREYHHRILNVHPALLPSFGGKGMYGHHVHEAVLQQGCKVSGVTVHLVDEVYDQGPVVAQRCVPVEEDDTPDTLAARVLKVEHELFPEAIQLFAEERVSVKDGRTIIR
ncbi:phosphoribosylglycinamide formyltransferase [candidate division KSB1 bacterium]|nr:phosphoribosylglycinamide formyltransferase [candidate division KSB1 bacterium]